MSDERETDHLDEAESFTEAGAQAFDAGNLSRAERYFELASCHAQIAQTEQLKRIGDLLDGTTDAPGLIGVTGHVTTGSP